MHSYVFNREFNKEKELKEFMKHKKSFIFATVKTFREKDDVCDFVLGIIRDNTYYARIGKKYPSLNVINRLRGYELSKYMKEYLGYKLYNIREENDIFSIEEYRVFVN